MGKKSRDDQFFFEEVEPWNKNMPQDNVTCNSNINKLLPTKKIMHNLKVRKRLHVPDKRPNTP